MPRRPCLPVVRCKFQQRGLPLSLQHRFDLRDDLLQLADQCVIGDVVERIGSANALFPRRFR